MWLGFWAPEVPVSPKSHDQLVGLPVDWSVKSTVSGSVPLVGEPTKSATGAPVTVILVQTDNV